MTTIGILGPASRRADIDTLSQWAEVMWGVDLPAEAMMRARDTPVDVLVVDASVTYLSKEFLSWAASSPCHVVAHAESEGMFDWVARIDAVMAVRSLEDIRALVGIDAVAGTSDSAESSMQHHARVIAVWGPVGSPGLTTTAISLAAVCAAAGHRTYLCDVDTRGASVAIALGVADETPGFAAACRLAARDELTEKEIARVTSTVRRGDVSFSVLTGLPRASRWVEVAPERSRRVIELCRSLVDVVVIDVGFGIEENDWVDDAPQRDGAAREMLRLADCVVAVGSAEPVGLSRFIRGLDEIRDLTESPVMVLNKVARGTASDSVDAIRRFTDREIRHVISVDSRGGVDEALTRALSNPAPWRTIVSDAGVALSAPSKPRWRR